jgi:hypothetical protein
MELRAQEAALKKTERIGHDLTIVFSGTFALFCASWTPICLASDVLSSSYTLFAKTTGVSGYLPNRRAVCLGSPLSGHFLHFLPTCYMDFYMEVSRTKALARFLPE